MALEAIPARISQIHCVMTEQIPLPVIIRNQIQEAGPMTFRDFMEMALYHPEHGYYNSTRPKLGEGGDFYTSSYVTELFGELLARQLEEMWRLLDGGPFTVVEYGAGTGLLCQDILSRLKLNPALYEKLNYFIIERSSAMRERERRLISNKVQWKDSIADIGPITGCVFSNELVDNFSVHRVVMADELMEIYVGFDREFVEVLRPASAELKDYLFQMGVQLPRGYHAEINLQATNWIREVGAAMRQGWVMTIDYGYPAAALYSKQSGTLACYRNHQVHHSPYENIGEQDITAHVNFTALDHWGSTQGLEVCGYTNQTHFLQGLGLAASLRIREQNGIRHHDLLQLRAFLLEMGQKFKVLIQHKGVKKAPLSGLLFSHLLG